MKQGALRDTEAGVFTSLAMLPTHSAYNILGNPPPFSLFLCLRLCLRLSLFFWWLRIVPRESLPLRCGLEIGRTGVDPHGLD